MGLRSICKRFWQILTDFGKKKIIFLDEVHFDIGGYVNKQNCYIWDTENPPAYIEKPTHSKRVTVWGVFWSKGIIQPFFFENEEGVAVTVNSDRYRGEATADVLRPGFEDRIISRRPDDVRPPRN